MAISTLTNKYSATKNYNFELISENQLFKEVSINENFFLIDSIMMIKVSDYLDKIPENIEVGFSFIIKSGITGELADYENFIVVLGENNTWNLINPREGMKCITNKNIIADYKDSKWIFSNFNESSGNGDQSSIDISDLINDNLLNGTKNTYSIDKINSITNSNKSLFEDAILNVRNIETKISENTTLISELSDLINSNSAEISKNKGDISENTKNITDINVKISSIISDNSTTGSDKTYSIDKISSLLKNNKDLIDLNTNIINKNTNDISENTNSINKINSINNTTKSILDSNTSKIATIETKVANNTDLINNISLSLNSNIDKVNSIDGKINTLQTKYDGTINDGLSSSKISTYSIDKILSLIEAINSSGSSQQNLSGFSIGDYKKSVKTANHDNWLLCDGSEILVSSYQSLYSIIGNNFGIATKGNTYFKLPDFRGRVFGAIGQGSGLTNRELGQSIGAENHTLTINEMPKHSHQQNISANSGSDAIRRDWTSDGLSNKYPQGINTESSGGGLPHNNMQPTLFGGNIFILAK